ncbi:MAG: hypothetical protein LUQ39_01340, partial [Methanomassiliicoccales archaeon]|nr:hypothetical protein [Methanomassiliicoccales archaeon]
GRSYHSIYWILDSLLHIRGISSEFMRNLDSDRLIIGFGVRHPIVDDAWKEHPIKVHQNSVIDGGFDNNGYG